MCLEHNTSHFELKEVLKHFGCWYLPTPYPRAQEVTYRSHGCIQNTNVTYLRMWPLYTRPLVFMCSCTNTWRHVYKTLMWPLHIMWCGDITWCGHIVCRHVVYLCIIKTFATFRCIQNTNVTTSYHEHSSCKVTLCVQTSKSFIQMSWCRDYTNYQPLLMSLWLSCVSKARGLWPLKMYTNH